MSKVVDWAAVELDYRAGLKSLKLIGKEQGVSDAGILKRARKEGWTRDLHKKIQQKTEAKLAEAAVRSERVKASESVVVEANAQIQTNVILAHRTDIQRFRAITNRLVEELMVQTEHTDLLTDLERAVNAEGGMDFDDRIKVFNRVISLGNRAGIMKTLSDSLRNLIVLERQAFGLDVERQDGGTGIEDLIQRVRGHVAAE